MCYLSVFNIFTNTQTRLEKYILFIKKCSTDNDINAPQRKKEMERYGEREKLFISW